MNEQNHTTRTIQQLVWILTVKCGFLWGARRSRSPIPPLSALPFFLSSYEVTVWESAFGICLWHLLIALTALSLSLPGPRVEIEAAEAAC
jgi:hypothetical protein